MNATTTQTTIARQLNVFAPAFISYNGKYYRRSRVLLDGDGLTVRQDYTATKARGAFLADKVSFSVTYRQASDTYDVTSAHIDGATLDSVEVKRTNGVHFDALDLLGLMC